MASSNFDRSRITALLGNINDMHIPEAANQLTWVTIDYLQYLKSEPESVEPWDTARHQAELEAADRFVQLVTEPTSWGIVRFLAPELEVEDIAEETPELLTHVLMNIKSKCPKEPVIEERQDTIAALERGLQADVLEERIRLVGAAGEDDRNSTRTNTMVQTLLQVQARQRQEKETDKQQPTSRAK
ncbi:uncharacterized protein Z520_12317 [Fonsecaea multimorphosa CBS 102226]|uniref:Uncharacterized protein n=1 Tax=Fonsecaea multimorphosa CBS 102226 TaxID=1442371 RepID=A0A0D2GR50_9EURO|nr:uncharacterized protein Z520_12317 [Fonsecaea multimorphosa CBS 102226]KIX91990.1 hypothetical protein Z520_12317 [Fonsecaea multimorphosa CBS 102226]OAL19871.1 hypothetical protein AYO22_09398 [Fonsecaea multimorphosa]